MAPFNVLAWPVTCKMENHDWLVGRVLALGTPSFYFGQSMRRGNPAWRLCGSAEGGPTSQSQFSILLFVLATLTRLRFVDSLILQRDRTDAFITFLLISNMAGFNMYNCVFGEHKHRPILVVGSVQRHRCCSRDLWPSQIQHGATRLEILVLSPYTYLHTYPVIHTSIPVYSQCIVLY